MQTLYINKVYCVEEDEEVHIATLSCMEVIRLPHYGEAVVVSKQSSIDLYSRWGCEVEVQVLKSERKLTLKPSTSVTAKDFQRCSNTLQVCLQCGQSLPQV